MPFIYINQSSKDGSGEIEVRSMLTSTGARYFLAPVPQYEYRRQIDVKVKLLRALFCIAFYIRYTYYDTTAKAIG